MARVQIFIDDLWPLLEKHAAQFPSAVKAAVERTCLDGLRFVTQERLSYSREGPPQDDGLRVQTGTARRSVDQDVTLFPSTDRVVGRLGSPLDYVRAHELGFSGKVQVPAHVRRLHASRRTRTGRKVKVSEKQRLQIALSGRKTSVQVRAHSRQVNMAARRFFRDTLEYVGKDIPRHVRSALRFLAEQGFPPKPGGL